jgi:hypothetical protein
MNRTILFSLTMLFLAACFTGSVASPPIEQPSAPIEVTLSIFADLATATPPSPTAPPGILLQAATVPPERIFIATPTFAPDPERLGPQFPPNINPLTGLPVEDPAVLERRPIIAKISNAPPLVRPQSGIGAADHVFEHYTEGGLTRFSAVFLSQAPLRVGSIRSARLIDHQLMTMYGALLIFSGTSIGVGEILRSSDYYDRAYQGTLYGLPYYWRDEDIEVPHNMFANAAAIWERAARDGHQQRQPLEGLTFTVAPPANMTGPANEIDLRYRATRVRWRFDPEAGLYLRSADGLGHYDFNTMTQISAANVVVLYADHYFTDIIESQWQNSISFSIEIALWGEGDAEVFRDGRAYRAQWRRYQPDDLITLYDLEGQPLPLKPGSTWFQVFPLPEQQNPIEEWLTVS